MFKFTKVASALVLIALLGMIGCAQEVGDINRVQPNAIEKSAFEGEWYFRQTVVDVNATAITSFIGLEGPLERVEFGIEEDTLFAYRTHEDVIGIDTGSEARDWEHGTPVVAFPIQGHFDIQRSYNPSTGEQANVISENTYDRAWYERDYIRVSWNANEVASGVDPMVDLANEAAVEITPQNEGEEPTWYVERNAAGEVIYIDALTTYIFEPDWVECILEFGFPLYGGACGPETVVVRSSFMRIDQESTFIPREYSDFEFNDFGFFRTERAGYDQQYGNRDWNRVDLANIWHIWEDSRNPDGSVIPMADRIPEPIVYYLSPDFPEELKAATYAIADEMDSAFRRIVGAHWGVDMPVDPHDMGEVSYDLVPRMFYLCENPGGTDTGWETSDQGYALGYCQRQGVEKNLGDVRYSFMAWIDHPQLDGPVGYGPSGADPLTGEIISGNAYIYGAYLNTRARTLIDLVKLQAGEFDIQDYGHGAHMQAYFDTLRDENPDDVWFGTVSDRLERLDHLEQSTDALFAQPRVQHILSQSPDSFRLRNQAQVNPMERIRGTQLEQMAIFPEMIQGLSRGELSASDSLDEEWISELSLASIGDPAALMRDHDREISRWSVHGQNNACVLRMDDFNDPYIQGGANQLRLQREELRSRGLSEDEIDQIQWNEARIRTLNFVMAHEVGHTLGLRHNFEGSFDAMNFHREYWDLRETTFDRCDESNITFSNTGLVLGDLAPPECGDDASESFAEYTQRSADLLETIRNSRIHDFQYSTVMDYPANYQWFESGLGYYDYAALAYGYGDLVEVFDSSPNQLYVEVNYNPETDNFSNSEIRASQHLITTFDDVDEYFIRRANQIEGDDPRYFREEEAGHEHSYQYYHYSTYPTMFGGSIDAMFNRRLVPMEDAEGLLRVPYRNCSDEYRGSTIECNVWDMGADWFEIYDNLESGWNEYYVMRHFRRGRPGFGLWIYPHLSAVFNYYMAPMIKFYQHWLLRAASRGVAWYNSEWGGEDASLVAQMALDFLGNQITAPSVGTYYYDDDEEMYLNLDADLDYQAPYYFEIEENINPATDYLSINTDIGRFHYSQFSRNEDDEAGYYYYLKTEIETFFWAKWAAMMALVLPSVDVLGADTSSDSTAFSIPAYLIFPEEMTRFFGAIPREDFDMLGSCVPHEETTIEGDYDVMQRNLVTGAPEGCRNARVLNPYTDAYGNADFNMRLLSILYASAYFQSNYDNSWFDVSNVYIVGRGHQLEPGPDHMFEIFVDDNGIQYAALVPLEIDPELGEDLYVGAAMIRLANETMIERDIEFEANGLGSRYYELNNDLDGAIEDMRLLSQANEIFEGYNVFLPFNLGE